MSRKVTVELKIKVNMVVDEGIEIGQIIDELDCNIQDTTGYADVEDMEIEDYEVINSK